ncbi:malate dehydrogenase, partial [Vibrio cholerae]|nr:malate dehydrogenase [Vibrio cholerae]
GKITIALTKPADTAHDLALAYSPGVAEPVREIARDPENAYRYTGKGNLVAVISNGTAILGLGNLGPLASKPVMEGKALLFKRFAGVDAIDIEVTHDTVDEFVDTVARIADSFGGINLEDIKAPECFEIEQRLIERCNIPVFHDDQHGTAIVTAAGVLNALEIQGKTLGQARIVC